MKHYQRASRQVRPPFTARQLRSLSEYQAHSEDPYVCLAARCQRQRLAAQWNGLLCPKCGRVLEWVMEHHLDFRWKEDAVRPINLTPTHYEPTAEELAERCAEVRAGWSEWQLESRAGAPEPVETMVVDTAMLGDGLGVGE